MRTYRQFLSIPATARLLGRGQAAIRRAVQRGDLPAVQVKGCQPRIAASVVSGILEASGSTAPLRFGPNSDETPIRIAEPAGV